MIAARFGIDRQFLAPEVVQASAADCGPATLKCLLEGFGIPASYGRLREACQTDVEGTSIDALEDTAVALGLEAEQVMVPVDHLLIPEARTLPAIVVVRHANDFLHFVVAWRRLGGLIQVMDPAVGRRWVGASRLLEQSYIHRLPVSADAWKRWAESEEFVGPLERRLAALGLRPDQRGRLVASALASPGWRELATLDAATRMLDAVVRAGALRGDDAFHVLGALVERQSRGASETGPTIPERYWSVRPAPSANDGEELVMRGAVAVRALGRRRPSSARETSNGTLSAELTAAIREPSSRPWRDLLAFLRADGLLSPATLAVALLVAAASVILEALLLRGFLDLGRVLIRGDQQVAAVIALAIFVVALLVLDVVIVGGTLRLGRRLETRLRTAFLQKLPRLADGYFRSRLISDMVERCHSVHTLRVLPGLGGELLRSSGELMFTAAGIAWLDPAATPIVVIAAVVALGLPIAAHPVLAERDLRERTHSGALARFYLDALLGLVPARAHGAAPAIRRQHEQLLLKWAEAALGVHRIGIVVGAVQSLAGFGLAAWLLIDHLGRGGEVGAVLLLAYWALNLPLLGEEVALLARQYPSHRNVTLRLLEPLGAPEEPARSPEVSPATASNKSGGVAVVMENVVVVAAGRTILQDVSLRIEPGEHVAIVGSSGAGKSTLVGLLLGWHRASTGQLLIDGEIMEGWRRDALRRETAWVDPSVFLWNRSLLDNLRYGLPPDAGHVLTSLIGRSALGDIVETLPNGLQTHLGEGGGLVSGGEGQRIRFARAVGRPGVRLAILDEPFRGLGHRQRSELLSDARRIWHDATLICITHDVRETMAFPRVLVIDSGCVVEDGVPAKLAAHGASRYGALLQAETLVRETFWAHSLWRVQRLDRGQLVGDDQP